MHISRCDFSWVPAAFVHCLAAALDDLALAGLWGDEGFLESTGGESGDCWNLRMSPVNPEWSCF